MNLNIANVSLPKFSLTAALSKTERGHTIQPLIDRRRANIFFEIKRHLPYEVRAEMKIAAPDVAEQLIDIHQSSEDTILRDLIERFFSGAGNTWAKQLNTQK